MNTFNLVGQKWIEVGIDRHTGKAAYQSITNLATYVKLGYLLSC